MLPHNNLPAYLALEKDNICKAYIFAHQKSLLSIFLHNKASVSMGIWHWYAQQIFANKHFSSNICKQCESHNT